MLGCKSAQPEHLCRILIELIDTCWDVNNIARPAGSATSSELIDTCWDVNFQACQALPLYTLELIDTCWDVNKNDYFEVKKKPERINRYMLGCK